MIESLIGLFLLAAVAGRVFFPNTATNLNFSGRLPRRFFPYLLTFLYLFSFVYLLILQPAAFFFLIALLTIYALGIIFSTFDFRRLGLWGLILLFFVTIAVVLRFFILAEVLSVSALIFFLIAFLSKVFYRDDE